MALGVYGEMCRFAFINPHSREFRVKVNLTPPLSKQGIDWMCTVFVYITEGSDVGYTLEFTFQSYCM